MLTYLTFELLNTTNQKVNMKGEFERLKGQKEQISFKYNFLKGYKICTTNQGNFLQSKRKKKY